MDVFERIRSERGSLSNSFAKVADFICGNYEEVAFMSITEVARRSGVSESVVVRFSASLGYSGFAEMKKNIKYKVKKNLRMDARMMATNVSGESAYQDIFTAVLNCDISNLLSTLKNPYNKTFEQVVKDLKNANRVYVIGARGLAKMAAVTEFFLDIAGVTCIAINAADSADLQKLRALNKNYVLLALSLPRYDSRVTFAIQMAKKQKAKTIVISDSAFSPDAQLADLAMAVSIHSKTFTNSYCAVMAIINAIVAAIGIKYQDETMHSLKGVEDWIQRYNLQDGFIKQLDLQNENQEG